MVLTGKQDNDAQLAITPYNNLQQQYDYYYPIGVVFSDQSIVTPKQRKVFTHYFMLPC